MSGKVSETSRWSISAFPRGSSLTARADVSLRAGELVNMDADVPAADRGAFGVRETTARRRAACHALDTGGQALSCGTCVRRAAITNTSKVCAMFLQFEPVSDTESVTLLVLRSGTGCVHVA